MDREQLIDIMEMQVRRAAMEQPPLSKSAGDAAFRKVMERKAREAAARAARERGEAA